MKQLLDLPRLRQMNPLRAALTLVLCAPIIVYRLVLSPLLPRACRFHPSCSVYALGALQLHGPFKGSWLAFRRITRCHPFNPGGYDPVPPRPTSPTPSSPGPRRL